MKSDKIQQQVSVIKMAGMPRTMHRTGGIY